ncbi:uncharacterized protein B0T23DRAFT_403981 [Neurospora hispaniola]|uniref:Uncharacterized protein n=1 Tax=Neurospora hispaniola TaxID=588809 RepID=A0AAJ0IB55_9PEZI|nr:hypothetical protein B0T23DRAFT_403981 [Neurospora hispaniola]
MSWITPNRRLPDRIETSGYIGNWRIVYTCISRRKEKIINAKSGYLPNLNTPLHKSHLQPWKWGALPGFLLHWVSPSKEQASLTHYWSSVTAGDPLNTRSLPAFIPYDEHHWQTCRKFLRGRPFNLDRAPTKFDEAQEIRSKQAAYDTVGITDFENTKNMLILGTLNLRLSSTVTGPADGTNADYPSYGKDRTTPDATRRIVLFQPPPPENYIVPLTSALYLVDIASFAFKQAWNILNASSYIFLRSGACIKFIVDKRGGRSIVADGTSGPASISKSPSLCDGSIDVAHLRL